MPHSKGFAHRKDERTLKATTIGDVVDGLLRERTFARGMPIGQLASDWASVVGPRLAAESAPVSLERGDHRTLGRAGAVPGRTDPRTSPGVDRPRERRQGAGGRACRTAERLVAQGVGGHAERPGWGVETRSASPSIGRI